MTTEERVLAHLRQQLRPAMSDRWGIRSCVAATRITGAVLDYFGITWSAHAVQVVAFNALGWAEWRAGKPFDEWTDPKAWSIGIRGTGRIDPANNRWDGHLILTTRHHLVDMSLDQLTRPEAGIRVEPLVMPLHDDWPACGGQLTIESTLTGAVVQYAPMVDRREWRSAPDWRVHEDVRRVAATMIKETR